MTNRILYCILVLGSALLGCQPFDQKLVFERWAKVVFGLVAVLGIGQGFILLGWDLGWFALSEPAGRRLDGLLSFGGGLAVGLILCLFLSGQMFGKKKTNEPVNPEPNAARSASQSTTPDAG